VTAMAADTTFVMPDSERVEDLLSRIFDEQLEVADGDPRGDDGHYLAVYVDDFGETVALCACDTPFVAFAGAALSLVPFEVIEEMIASKGITTTILENFHEVMNICASLFMTNFGAEHLRLDRIERPAAADALVAEFLQKHGEDHAGAGFHVRIPRYGEGHLRALVS